MRIGINVLFWVPNAMGGTQTYSQQLIEGLAALDTVNDYVVFVNASAAGHLAIRSPRFRIQVCGVSGRYRLLRLLWEQFVLPQYVGRLGIDVLHSLGYLSPIAAPAKTVVTIPDMIHYVYPSDVELPKQILWRILFPLSLRRVDQAIALSNSVKGELCRLFPWAGPKTVVIGLGVDTRVFNPGRGPERRPANVPGRFVLSVASVSGHKNTEGLIRAFALVSARMPDVRLVLVGHLRPPYSERVRRLVEALGIPERVIFTGWIAEEELIRLYRTAEMLVFPSIYEGFGFPPLEAMACGCPVVASNHPPMPEISGEAALYFDPLDMHQMADTMMAVLSSGETRSRLVHKGQERVELFRWEEVASQTLETYYRCSGKPSSTARA